MSKTMSAELQNKLTVSKQEVIEIVIADLQEVSLNKVNELEQALSNAQKQLQDSQAYLSQKRKEFSREIFDTQLKNYTKLGWKISHAYHEFNTIDVRFVKETQYKNCMALFLSLSDDERNEIVQKCNHIENDINMHKTKVEELTKELEKARKEHNQISAPGLMKSRALKSLISKSEGGEEIIELISKIKKSFSLLSFEDPSKK